MQLDVTREVTDEMPEAAKVKLEKFFDVSAAIIASRFKNIEVAVACECTPEEAHELWNAGHYFKCLRTGLKISKADSHVFTDHVLYILMPVLLNRYVTVCTVDLRVDVPRHDL